MIIVEPKIRGFICTTAHPEGCAENVNQAADFAQAHKNVQAPKRVLVVGSSTGYGLACRIASTFGSGADTVGVFFERPAAGNRTATAGYYNNVAFEARAKQAGRKYKSINGDAFSKEVKEESISAIKEIMDGGQVDLVVYSLAAPRRTDHSGNTYSSVIKPIGGEYKNKTVNFHTGEVSEVALGAATDEEIAGTIKVMGGEDWRLWIEALNSAGVLAENAVTVAFSYIGPSLTHPVYRDGTIGRAKEDLEEKSREITDILSGINGKAYVSVNKALVTQASSAIPVVPLYISILFRLMKAIGSHEDCTQQAVRLLEKLYKSDGVETDSEGRIRLDDWEMDDKIQAKVDEIWQQISTENLGELSDIEGYKKDFYKLFGFSVDGVDYSSPVEIEL